MALASLYRCLLRTLWRRPALHAGFGPIDHVICAKNVWQAQQGGTSASFDDVWTGILASVRDVLETAIDLCADDAAALGCTDWVESTRGILERGSSADRQVATFDASDGHETAMRSVVQTLAF